MPRPLTRPDFQSWTESRPQDRFEGSGGRVVAMVPEHWVHARLKAPVRRTLGRGITAAKRACQAAPDGMTIEGIYAR